MVSWAATDWGAWAAIHLGPVVIGAEIDEHFAKSRFLTMFRRLPNINLRLRISLPYKWGRRDNG